MKYCENGTDFTEIWMDDGLNRCFLDTLTSGFLFVFMLLCGCIQCSMFRRYSSEVQKKYQNQNFGSICQIFLTLLLVLETFLHFILQGVISSGVEVSGFEILRFLCLCFAWLGTLRLLSLERKRLLPTVPTRGHGLVLLVFWALAFLRENLAFVSWWSHNWWWYLDSSNDNLELGFWVVRYTCTAILFIIGLWAPGLPKHPYRALLNDQEEGSSQATASQGSTWSNVIKKLKIMMPYVWPKGSRWRQLIVLGSLVILGAGRGINVLVPMYNKYIVNSLTYDQKKSEDVQAETLQFRWDFICIYSLLVFLRGGAAGQSGFLNNARTFLWIPVQQYTTRRIQVKLFSHLHNLSLSWHLQRKTGEVLRVVDRGTNSINNLLNYVVFQILPTIIDIIIAIVYFVTVFNYVFGIVVFIAMAMYLAVTVAVTEWRTKYRREMNLLDNATNSKAVDSLLNFETVKYYGASDFEVNRYNEAIIKYQVAEWKSTASLNLLNTLQNTVVTGGILSASLLCAWAVVHGVNGLTLTVGDYVLFGTYILQLYGPLNFLGTYYRMIQQAFIDMENMFELLDVGYQVRDVPGAKAIELGGGEIEFKDVEFHYDPSKQILKNVSFKVPAGETYALVGHSGSGKSTIIRLLFRFYDIQGGHVTIDGQDISQVTQDSLRKCIGVVPQDTVLFNNDILYNIRYGRVTATDDDVMAAADAADIHKRILTFTNKYETMVGERGLKLSGGEKQRVAIARTLLKAPAIVLLDEATSALDTRTERNIQTSLARVCENRTTIIVAHRLSTIIHANQILVMKEGEIVERGTHEELIHQEGHYAEMWQQQLTKLDDDTTVNGDSLNGAAAGAAPAVEGNIN